MTDIGIRLAMDLKELMLEKSGEEKNHDYLVELNSNAAGCVWGQVHPKFLRHGEETEKINKKKSEDMIFGQLTRDHG